MTIVADFAQPADVSFKETLKYESVSASINSVVNGRYSNLSRLLRGCFLVAVILTTLLITTLATYADCIDSNGKSVPTGSQDGPYTCSSDGTWHRTD